MAYSVRVVEETGSFGFGLTEIKNHLRYPYDDQDDNIQLIYLPTARKRVEELTNRQLVTASMELSLDRFPCGTDPILIPRAPLQSVESIVYVDSAGEEQTLDAERYVVDANHEPGRVFPAYGTSWPSTRERTSGGTVKVTFTAGYTNGYPAELFQAMLLLVGHYFYHREAVTMGATPKEVPRAVEDLCEAFSYGDEFCDYGGGA